ncbi:hypothetical protein VM1G_02260 [Cytospora mali]|uniref:Uncharacterized protein n=1 Tax=Cytospora mali TaxID=578113 RepID=A0A194VRH4_CYTMA|nr:hypothetical protein VM1G_02260 [Valsa mali]
MPTDFVTQRFALNKRRQWLFDLEYRSLIKRVSFEKFEKVCEKNGICGGSDKILGLEAFEDDSLDEDGLPNIGALSVQDN